MIIDKLRVELANSDDSENIMQLKMKIQQNAEYYEKKIKELKQIQHGKRQEQISLQVQLTMAGDTIKQLSNYLKERSIDDLDLIQMVDDLEYQIEEIISLVHDTNQQQSVQVTQRGSYQSLHQNLSVQNFSVNNSNNQHKSRDFDELKNILSMKEREIQALKKDNQDLQTGYAQQQQYQKHNKNNEFLYGGYYSGKGGSKSYYS